MKSNRDYLLRLSRESQEWVRMHVRRQYGYGGLHQSYANGRIVGLELVPLTCQLITYTVICISFPIYCTFISSPEPTVYMWAYNIGRHPSSVRPSVQHFQTTSPLKPWSRFLPNFTYNIYRPGERIIVFCSNRIRTLVARATYSCHWLIMGKVEIGIYCCLTADILTKDFSETFFE